MEKKLVILDEYKLLDISGKLFNFLEVVKFVAEFTGDAHYGNIMRHCANCLTSISEDLDTLLDNTPTVSDEAALYLWRRMLKTGKRNSAEPTLTGSPIIQSSCPTWRKRNRRLMSSKRLGESSRREFR